jgi:hypothetical protein
MAEAGGLFYSSHPDPGQHQALSDKIGRLALNRCGVAFCWGLGVEIHIMRVIGAICAAAGGEHHLTLFGGACTVAAGYTCF